MYFFFLYPEFSSVILIYNGNIDKEFEFFRHVFSLIAGFCISQ